MTDNDGDIEKCKTRYADYEMDQAKVFFDADPVRKTFEIAIYKDNTAICDELFEEGRKTLSVQQYMLDNKTDVAFALLEKEADTLSVPPYIQQAIQWIRE